MVTRLGLGGCRGIISASFSNGAIVFGTERGSKLGVWLTARMVKLRLCSTGGRRIDGSDGEMITIGMSGRVDFRPLRTALIETHAGDIRTLQLVTKRNQAINRPPHYDEIVLITAETS